MNKKDLYNELLKLAIESGSQLDVIHDDLQIVENRIRAMVDKIFDLNITSLSDIIYIGKHRKGKYLNDKLLKFRISIGILIDVKQKIHPRGMESFKELLVENILFDSTMEYYKEKVKNTGKPIPLSTDIKKLAMPKETSREINKIILDNHPCYSVQYKLHENIPFNGTLCNLVNLNMTVFYNNEYNFGDTHCNHIYKNVLKDIITVLDATGYGMEETYMKSYIKLSEKNKKELLKEFDKYRRELLPFNEVQKLADELSYTSQMQFYLASKDRNTTQLQKTITKEKHKRKELLKAIEEIANKLLETEYTNEEKEEKLLVLKELLHKLADSRYSIDEKRFILEEIQYEKNKLQIEMSRLRKSITRQEENISQKVMVKKKKL